MAVIHVRDMKPGDTYIGRRVPRLGFFVDSPWANPFRIDEIYTREESIRWFEDWVRTSNATEAVWCREHIGELHGKRLACWCHPKPCHGQVLLQLLREAEINGS